VISQIDHRPVASVEELRQALHRHPAGAPVLMLVQRDGDPLWLAVAA
jgi:S1-C subfamily serine protease